MQMTQNTERKYGPNRNETLDEVQARLDRQAITNDLVDLIAGYHASAGRYADPKDFARQVACGILADFVLVRRAS